MKTKICEICKNEDSTLFRVQVEKGKTWIFVCGICCLKVKDLAHYRYGGTWKGYRH